MWPRLFALAHPAAPLLTGYADDGCPVDCGPPWSPKHILLSLRQGPHKSALTSEARIVLHKETAVKEAQGYAKVVRWRDIKQNLPPNLKISPVACIPHKSKPLRVIIDLSFQLKVDKLSFPSVNDTTTKLAPAEAMVQLGLSLKRLISIMAKHYDKNLPFRFAKLDIKDGFWRLVVNEADAWHFAYVLPPKVKSNIDLDDTQLVIPTSLQMGWCESPPFFCASSETARDVIQTLLDNNTSLPPHPYEHYMMGATPSPLPSTASTAPPARSVDIIEVFVDDFIGATNTQMDSHKLHLSRAMLHGIHTIYPPPAITKHSGEDPIANKKLREKDGLWLHVKEILGWIFDGEAYTIALPEDKCDRILKQIKKGIKMPGNSPQTLPRTAGKIAACLLWHSRRLRVILSPTNGPQRHTCVYLGHSTPTYNPGRLAGDHTAHAAPPNPNPPPHPHPGKFHRL